MAYYTQAQCEARLDQLLTRLTALYDAPKYTQDAAGLVLQEQEIASLEKSIALWEERRDKAISDSSGVVGSAIKLIRRRPV